MKIREILHDNTRIWKILPLWARTLLNHVHELQTKVDVLMTAHEATKTQVASNTAYKNKNKYVTPKGEFRTYALAAAAETPAVSWTVIRRKIKDENETGYYLNV